MFAFRRAAARAIFTKPIRQSSTFKPASLRQSIVQLEKSTSWRSLHQASIWRADEQQKYSKDEASPAEAETSGETVTTEPSASEQAAIREESITAPDVVKSAKQTVESAGNKLRDTTDETASRARSTASTISDQVQELSSNAAAAIENAASYTAQNASSAFPRQRLGRSASSLEPPPPSKVLYIGNLFFEVTAPQLEAEFGRHGEIVNSRVVTDNRGMSKGFGYLEFATQQSADRAVQEMNQKVFQGRRLAVQYHVRREGSGRSSRPLSAPDKTLFIGNMSYQMSDRDLNDLFREIQNVVDVRVAIDRRSGQPRGFAHADFIDIESAKRAKEYLEKQVVYGRQLKVDFTPSKPYRERSSADEMES